MSEVVLVAEVEFVPGREEEALAALRELCEQTHANDAGCTLYAAHQVVDDPLRAIVIERWESGEALEAHGQAAHVTQVESVEAFAGPPRVLVLFPSGFGEPGKASLGGSAA